MFSELLHNIFKHNVKKLSSVSEHDLFELVEVNGSVAVVVGLLHDGVDVFVRQHLPQVLHRHLQLIPRDHSVPVVIELLLIF